MARSIRDIHESILADIRRRPELAQLNSTSATALYVLFAYVVATAIATLENLFDLAAVELREEVARHKPHTLRYYQQRALAFRLGVDLLQGRTDYPPAPDPETLAEQQIVQYAAVREAGDTLQLKVAKAGIFALETMELVAFADYIGEVKDAGVRIAITSAPADRLKAALTIYYNPQVMDAEGRRLDGSDDRVVENAIRRYTESLRFDGLFVRAHLVDELQRTEGVQIPVVTRLEARRTEDEGLIPIQATYEPASGFMRLYDAEDITITYIPYADA